MSLRKDGKRSCALRTENFPRVLGACIGVMLPPNSGSSWRDGAYVSRKSNKDSVLDEVYARDSGSTAKERTEKSEKSSWSWFEFAATHFLSHCP
jgi:hypothetical protein